MLEDVIGSGAMGTVYKAIDRNANAEKPFIAIKVLNPELAKSQTFIEAMKVEATNALDLTHENIVRVRDFDLDDHYAFLTMEYLKGRSLKQIIQESQHRGMNFNKAWPIIEGMCEAVKYMHKKGIIHADFKPANVFRTDEGNIKVLDFGIARQIEATDATVIDEIDRAHTPAYSTIERINGGTLDKRDDIYSLSCVIYELLTGKHPFGKSSSMDKAEVGLNGLRITPDAVPSHEMRGLWMLVKNIINQFYPPPDKTQAKNIEPTRIISLSKKQWNMLKQGLALERKNRIESVDKLQDGLQPRIGWKRNLWMPISIVSIMSMVWLWIIMPINITIRPIDKVLTSAGDDQEIKLPLPAGKPPTPIQGPRTVKSIPNRLPFKNVISSPDELLSVAVESTEYHIGDKLKIYFTVAKPLYLRLYHFDSSGEGTILYPDSEEIKQQKQVKKNIIYEYPNNDDNSYLKIREPIGFDQIVAVASDHPFPDDFSISIENGNIKPKSYNGYFTSVLLKYQVR